MIEIVFSPESYLVPLVGIQLLPVSSLALCDFLPALFTYPFGYLFILVFLLLFFYFIRKYNFTDLLPPKLTTQIINERNRAQMYFDAAGVLFIVLDLAGKITRINKKGCQILEQEEQDVIGKNWFESFLPDEIQINVQKIFSDLISGKTEPMEYYENPVLTKSGKRKILAWNNSILKNEKGEIVGTICSGSDITKRKEAEEKIRELAYYDILTGLPNRRFFKEILEQAIRKSKRHNEKLAIMFVDLDHFKRINDTLGHDIGDKLLKEVSAALVRSTRKTDFVANLAKQEESGNVVSRSGGDEFLVLLTDLKASQDAAKAANRILEELSKASKVDSHDIYISASIGISIHPDDGIDGENLFKNSDIAMYHAKKKGRNNWQYYSKSLNDRAYDKLTLEHQLRKAVDNEEFEVYYQPIYNLKTSELSGLEALLRWNHPDRGILPPLEFIPLAEETGLIVPMGDMVIDKVCSQYKKWLETNISPFIISINLSNRQLDEKNFKKKVLDKIASSGLAPGNIVFEITESTIMQNPDDSIQTLKAWKEFGLKVSIDDFGTGYSSLNYLGRIPLDFLKIDKSFIMNIRSETSNATITATIIAMSHILKLKVVAEGVQNRDQLEFLKEMGCDEVQGYIFSPPLPPNEIEYFFNKKFSIG